VGEVRRTPIVVFGLIGGRGEGVTYMIPVICVVGEQDSGKTTLIEALTGEIVRRGFKVSTIKHTSHSFELDKEGSDSYRHMKAGADKVALSCATQFALMEKRISEKELDDIALLLEPGADIILTEGYKWLDKPKIKMIKKDSKGTHTLTKEENIIATVGRGSSIREGIPDFNIDEAHAIADFLEGKFMKKKAEDSLVQLKVNGKDVRIKGFVQDILAKAILGMISTLRGTEKPKEVEIRIRV